MSLTRRDLLITKTAPPPNSGLKDRLRSFFSEAQHETVSNKDPLVLEENEPDVAQSNIGDVEIDVALGVLEEKKDQESSHQQDLAFANVVQSIMRADGDETKEKKSLIEELD